jgi:hypothetical protein
VREEQTAHGCELLIKQHLPIAVLVEHTPAESFPALSLCRCFHFVHVLLLFYLLLDSVKLCRPVTCSLELSYKNWIVFGFVIALSEINLRLIKGREVLKGVLGIVLELVKVDFLVLIHDL